MSQQRHHERERDERLRPSSYGAAPDAPKPGQGDPFVIHVPSVECAGNLDAMRRRFRALRDDLVREIPQGRELSLAITHLQEAMNHAICGIVTGDPQSEPRP